MTEARYQCLFEPLQIGPVTAPNRFYAVPHATGHGWNQPHGAIALRGMKAEGGWGTVCVQITEIAANADMANHPMERLWDDSDLPRHIAQVEAIKKHGSLAGIELGHGGMRCRNITTGQPVIGPSALPVLRPEVPLQSMEMHKRDISAFRQSHKQAAERAKKAGYDILYVYAAHDLSIFNNFLSLRTNQRSDEYGGSLQNRLRLLKEVIEDTLDVADGECAVALRFSVAEPGARHGLKHDDEGRDIVATLAELPDLWDVNLSGWSYDSCTARFSDEGFQQPYTEFVKTLTSKPVVGVGRFTSPDLMASLLRKGKLDLIGAARPSIADPFLPNKIASGKTDAIRECIGCNICVSMDSYGLPLRCTQNPTISEEWRCQWHPEAPAIGRARQAHLIIGAGPAGLETATTLLRAGHRVTIAEQRLEAGGRVSRESKLPGLNSWGRVTDYRLHQLSQSADAHLYLDSKLSIDDIETYDCDHVIIATGASWRRDGVGSCNFDAFDSDSSGTLDNLILITPDDVMGESLRLAPSRIVVYDDDHFYMASVIAEALSYAGHRVHYTTTLAQIATWTDNTLEQPRIIERLRDCGVSLHPNTRLESDGSLTDLLTLSPIPLSYDVIAFIGARKPDDGLYNQLQARGNIEQLHRAGDCISPGTIQAAVYSGHRLARLLLSENGGTGLREQVTLHI